MALARAFDKIFRALGGAGVPPVGQEFRQRIVPIGSIFDVLNQTFQRQGALLTNQPANTIYVTLTITASGFYDLEWEVNTVTAPAATREFVWRLNDESGAIVFGHQFPTALTVGSFYRTAPWRLYVPINWTMTIVGVDATAVGETFRATAMAVLRLQS